jgi:hypothetical protein
VLEHRASELEDAQLGLSWHWYKVRHDLDFRFGWSAADIKKPARLVGERVGEAWSDVMMSAATVPLSGRDSGNHRNGSADAVGHAVNGTRAGELDMCNL